MLDIDDAHPFHQLMISIALGLLVGLQRQWAESSLAGARTFSLISLLGTVCAFLAERFGGWVLVAGFLGVTAAMVAGNFLHVAKQESSQKVGLSTEISMLLMFAVGALVRAAPIWLAAASAGAMAVILQAKLELHKVASRFTGKELSAMMQFVLISLVIFPVIPNETIDYLHVINPREVWLMVILIVGIGLAGYVVYKFYGENAGTLLSGILGGMISSTATTASYSKSVSSVGEQAIPQSATIIVIAWTTVYVRLFFETAVVAWNFRAVWPPLGVMFVVSAFSSIWLWRKSTRAKSKMPLQENPSELRTGLVFAAIYSAVLFGVTFAKQRWGTEGIMTMAVLSGVTDMDAITLSTSRLVQSGQLSPEEGWPAIVAAASSNVFFKGIIVLALGGMRLFRGIAGPWIAALTCGLGILILWGKI